MDNKEKKGSGPSGNRGNIVVWILITIGILYMLNTWTQTQVEKPVQDMAYAKFYALVKDNTANTQIKSCVKVENTVKGSFVDGTRFIVNIPENDQDLVRALRDNVKDFDVKPPKTLLMNLFYSLGPMVLFIVFLWLFVYRGNAAGGAGKIWAFGKSRAVLASGSKLKVTFEDVAGVEEAKEELKDQIVEVSIDVAGKILEEKLSGNDERRLAEEFVKGIEIKR